MLPHFAKTGNLPPGIHSASWLDVRRRFGTNGHRRRLLRRVRPALRALKRAGCTSVYLAGSFFSRKNLPGDIDVLWDPAGVDTTVLDRLAPILADDSPSRRAEHKRRYGAEFIPTTVPRSGSPYLDFFQTEKGTDAPRGIVRLDLRRFP